MPGLDRARSQPSGASAELRAEAAGSVLVIDAEPLRARALVRVLAADRHRIAVADGVTAARTALWRPGLEVVLADRSLAEPRGLDLLTWLKRERPQLQVVVVAGPASIASAVGWVRDGAYDYLPESLTDAQQVRAAVWGAIRRTRLLRRNRELERNPPESLDAFERILGPTAARGIARTLSALRRVDRPVWLRGELGTGRGALARVLHERGSVAAGPFVRVVSAEWTVSGVETACRSACGGSLFLDEVGNLSGAVQAALLRALRRQVPASAVGCFDGAKGTASGLRWVASSRRSPRALVRAGSLRPELAYRLSEIQLEIPPLRDRPQDVLPLAHHFLGVHAGTDEPRRGIEADAIDLLLQHDWPGNLRELESAMRGAASLARGPRVCCGDLRGMARAADACDAAAASEEALPLSLAAYEKRALERALRECEGDARASAARLGIGRSTFYRKLARHGLRVRAVDSAVHVPALGTTRTLG